MGNFNKLLTNLISRVLFSRQKKIVVASTGRAGSTMLFKAIANSLIAFRFGIPPEHLGAQLLRRYIMGYVDSIKSVDTVPYLICKTHDELTQLDTDVKFIFVYGDPFDSALSVNSMVQRLGIDWFSEHQQHLRASGEFCDLYKKDVLNYEGQINSWMAVRRTNIFCVDYDDLWSMIDELERFCEFPIELPERRIRESTSRPELVQSELFEKLRHIKNSAKQKYHDSHANEYFG